MWELYTSVGLGQKPQIGFPGVVTGRLRPYKSWRRIEQVTMSYGYGLSASLFQLAQAYTVFARDGELIPISLIKRDGSDEVVTPKNLALRTDYKPGLTAAPSPELAPVHGTRVFSPETMREVRKMLSMVTANGGTAPKAQAMGYSVGGKTGTANKQEGKGYASHKYRSWFVGIAPISNPRIVVAVMVDEPGDGIYFGGDVAAPVFSQVVEQTLNRLGVMPDLDVRPDITAMKGEEESF